MKICFLADANLDQDIVLGLWRREPRIDFALPQDLLPDGMSDPEVLALASQRGSILVSHDVRTMPRHFGTFLLNAESPGLILIPYKTSVAAAIEELLLIWMASEPEEWKNQMRRLPL